MANVSSVYSTASTISDKLGLQKIGDAVKSGVSKVANALESGANKAAANVKSRFNTNDAKTQTPAASAKQKRPEEVPAIKYAGALTFPAELKYFAMFDFRKYKRVDVFEMKKELNDVTIILPLPADLSESFGATYETPALGPIAGAMGDFGIAVARELAGSGQVDMKARIEDTNKQFKNLNVKQGLYVLGRNALTSGNETGIIDRASGVIPNPHLAAIFSNVGLRTHQFSYKLVPNNAKELATIKNIIYNLKTRMLPGLLNDSNFLLTFPDTCQIHLIAGEKEVYKIKECVLETLDINYSPNGPAFFKTGDPVEVTINMMFREISAFTREDVAPFTDTTQYTGLNP